LVCEDAESFWKSFCGLKGREDDPHAAFEVIRLKNKLGKSQEPFNFHLNVLFRPSATADPLVVEIQIWIASIMALNDISHWQYEISRAKRPEDV